MRVYRRSEFLALPAGTLFHSGRPWAFGTLCVKGESLSNDFVSLEFGWVDANDSGEALERLEAMLGSGVSFPLNTDFGRDGAFAQDDVCLVYEQADLQKLLTFVVAAQGLGGNVDSVIAEREACAKIAEQIHDGRCACGEDVADAIRARSGEEEVLRGQQAREEAARGGAE